MTFMTISELTAGSQSQYGTMVPPNTVRFTKSSHTGREPEHCFQILNVDMEKEVDLFSAFIFKAISLVNCFEQRALPLCLH